MTSHLDPLKLTFRRIGLILTVVSAALTGLFGITMSSNWLLACLLCVGLMAATVASAYVWPFVSVAIRERHHIAAGILAAFGCLVTTTDLTTNFGSIAWQRGTNIDEAKVSEIRFGDSRAQVEDNRANLKMWKEQLAKLNGEHAWAATVTADGLRAELETATEAVRQEERRGGCGPRCLAKMADRDAIAEKIAVAEQVSGLNERIAATQALVDKYRVASASVEKVESAAALQNVSLASMFTLSRSPTEEAQHWTDKGVAWLVAAFFTFGAMGCNFIGWGAPAGGGGISPRRAMPIRSEPQVETEVNGGAMVLKYFEGNGDTRTWLAQAIDEAKAKARAGTTHGVAA